MKIRPLAATLATMPIFDSVTQVYTGNIGTFIRNERYTYLSVLGRGSLLGIPLKIWVTVVVFALAIVLYHL